MPLPSSLRKVGLSSIPRRPDVGRITLPPGGLAGVVQAATAPPPMPAPLPPPPPVELPALIAPPDDDPDVIKQALRACRPDAHVLAKLGAAVDEGAKWAIELWMGYLYGRPVERNRLDVMHESRATVNWLVELRRVGSDLPAASPQAAVVEGDFTEAVE